MHLFEILKNKLAIFRSQPTTAVFLLVLLASFFWHAGNRTEHFQECDSSGVYDSMYNFPQNAVKFVAVFYPPSQAISPETAKKIIENPIIKKTISNTVPKAYQNLVVEKLSNTGFSALIRLGIVQGVSMIGLPHAFKSFFSLPLTSTYSAGSGLFYGFISTPNASWEDFLSRASLITVTLFHISALLVFLICRRLKIPPIVAAISSLLMLFSISFYSYGYHLGSTVWNVTSEFFWLYGVITFWPSQNRLKNISWLSGVLVFFNYLILLFWASLILHLIWQKNKQNWEIKKVFTNLFALIKTQRAAIILTLLCLFLFFKSGHGLFGFTTQDTFFSDIYYIVLNFFSFSVHNQPINIFQFALGMLIFWVAGYWIFKKQNEHSEAEPLTQNIFKYFLIIFVLLIATKKLGFAPTRHMLFLAPIIFIGLGGGLHILLKKHLNYFNGSKSHLVLILLISLLGFYSLSIRALDTRDNTAGINLPTDVKAVGVYDCSYNLVYKHWPEGSPEVKFMSPKNFFAGETYGFLSQTGSFNSAAQDWNKSFDINFELLDESTLETNTYFTAFNPDFERFRFTRPNNVYLAKFKILNVKPKPD